MGSNLSIAIPQQKTTTPKGSGIFGGKNGIRTHVPETDNRISSAARYDHFDTFP